MCTVHTCTYIWRKNIYTIIRKSLCWPDDNITFYDMLTIIIQCNVRYVSDSAKCLKLPECPVTPPYRKIPALKLI